VISLSLSFSEQDYLAGLEEYKNHLHGRIVLSKGDKSLTHLEVCKKLEGSWRSLGSWKVIPIGKGF